MRAFARTMSREPPRGTTSAQQTQQSLLTRRFEGIPGARILSRHSVLHSQTAMSIEQRPDMKARQLKSVVLVLSISITAFGCKSSEKSTTAIDAAGPAPLEYVVNLNDRSGDTFKVTLSVDDLTAANAVYQFASTAPGTYQVMDIGRFVRSFEARDDDGKLIPSENISTNQWRISDPTNVATITYSLAETWDTPVDKNPVYMMAGTSIEDDHALINGQAVFGYPTGMQSRPLKIKLEYPTSWKIGTALQADAQGFLRASDYDEAVDSPILLGRLSTASVTVRGADIGIYTYSKTDKVTSDMVLASVKDILESAGDFLVELPVDRYAFLLHFEDVSMGAWEHSYSSEYVFAEAGFEQAINQAIPSIVAHEFYHIVTPLNIHSEVIEHFNFVTPVPSEHVWLYEGTTEWEAHIAQLRSGLITLDEYLSRLSGKVNADEHFDPAFTISQIGLESFSEKGQQEWGNIYQRGALVAGLLDLRLLELSGGKRGLREVLLELSDTYGPDKPFSEKTFFDDFAKMTYPEIRPFFDRYIRDNQPLPFAEYYEEIGIEYLPEYATGKKIPMLGLQLGVENNELVMTGTSDVMTDCGFEVGDVLVGFNGAEVSLANAQEVLAPLPELQADETFTMTVRRDGEKHTYSCARKLIDEIQEHVFRVDPAATPQQVALRNVWLKNLPVERM